MDARAARRYVRVAPLPDALVYLRANPETALGRLAGRDRQLADRFAGMSPERSLQMMRDSQQMFEGILEEAQASGRSMVTVVIDANDLDAAWRELEKQLVGQFS